MFFIIEKSKETTFEIKKILQPWFEFDHVKNWKNKKLQIH